MGYVSRGKPAQLTVNSPITPSFEIEALPNDLPLYDITTPAYGNKPTHAYFDLIISQAMDNSGALNYLESAGGFVYFQINSGGSWRNAITIYNETFYIPASSYITGEIRLVGTTDIAQYLSPSTAYNIKVAAADAHADHIWIYGVYAQLRMYFE